jgi:uncharacterized protein YgbK (DUF1537 family)
MKRMGVVADDITGANDIGGMFARGGYRAYVYSGAGLAGYEQSPKTQPEPEVCILDTNSRLDLAATAYDKVFAATRALQQAGYRQFHKKTCSVFRGNVGAEFDAMLDALGLDFAVVVLGFPKNGRTTLNGIHYVHGQRLEESPFRYDPIHPMTRSNLADILRTQTQRRVTNVPHAVVAAGPDALRAAIDAERGRNNYVILDVTGQADLAIIARAVAGEPVLAGSSALAEELPAEWGGGDEAPGPLKLPRADGVGVLCIAGSLTPQTTAQIEHLRAMGVPCLELNTLPVGDPGGLAAEVAGTAAEAARRLRAGEDTVVHSPYAPAKVAATVEAGAAAGLTPTDVGRRVSEALAEAAAQALSGSGQNRLVIAGGETSAAVCARLGVNGMQVWKEIEPGLPSCVSLDEPRRLLVLKSGSFGQADFLEKALLHVKAEA